MPIGTIASSRSKADPLLAVTTLLFTSSVSGAEELATDLSRGEGGHDPEEDARAGLDLLKTRVANGPGYGEFKVDQL
ncbi:hypothetical protein BC835DRAFT_1414931 [Cytidiella melzeri]|nr:hypothetical protein BC835DRAFT_1414931 [Cytidiella melzeri]